MNYEVNFQINKPLQRMAPTECPPSACLPACVLACLLAFLLACLPACLLAYLPACLPTCLPACLPACLLACLPACLLTCLPAYLLTCLLPSLGSLEHIFNVLLNNVTHAHTHANTTLPLLGLLSEPKTIWLVYPLSLLCFIRTGATLNKISLNSKVRVISVKFILLTIRGSLTCLRILSIETTLYRKLRVH